MTRSNSRIRIIVAFHRLREHTGGGNSFWPGHGTRDGADDSSSRAGSFSCCHHRHSWFGEGRQHIPLPGVTIIAVNSANEKFSTTTDETGTFQMHLPAGLYNVRASLAAFAPITQAIDLNTQPGPAVDFTQQLASRAASENASAARQNANARGTQSLSQLNSEPDAAPAAGAAAGDTTDTTTSIPDEGTATDSVAVTGQMGSTNALGGMSEDQIRQRVQDAIEQARTNGTPPGDIANAIGGMLGDMTGGNGGGGGGGRGFSGRGGGGGGGGRGAFRGFNPTQTHGAVFYTGGNSALNTRGLLSPAVRLMNHTQLQQQPIRHHALRLAVYSRALQTEHERVRLRELHRLQELKADRLHQRSCPPAHGTNQRTPNGRPTWRRLPHRLRQ